MGDEPSHPEALRKPDSSAASLWLVMMKAYRSVQNYIESSIAETGLGLSDFMILEALLHKGSLNMSQLGEVVLLANASTTAAVGRLQKLGLVSQCSTAEDRRVRTVQLTRHGRDVITLAYAQHEQDLEGLMPELCEEVRAELRSALKTIGLAAKARVEARQQVGQH